LKITNFKALKKLVEYVEKDFENKVKEFDDILKCFSFKGMEEEDLEKLKKKSKDKWLKDNKEFKKKIKDKDKSSNEDEDGSSKSEKSSENESKSSDSEKSSEEEEDEKFECI
jgi:hypothetical protein